MPATRNTTENERTTIVSLVRDGKSYRDISSKFFLNILLHAYFIDIMGILKSAVGYIYKNFITQSSVAQKYKSGRPSKVSKRIKRSICRGIIENPFSSPKLIKENYLPDSDISSRTIQRVMVNEGFKSYKARKKPFLSKANINKRISFCQMHANKPLEFWHKIIFSDETRICIFTSDRPPLIRRKLNDNPLNEKYLRPTVKKAQSLMVWGCFSKDSLGDIEIIENSIDSKKYVEILHNNLLPKLSEMLNHGDVYFQQDNAPCHKSKFTMNWLNDKGILTIDWPPQSPDLNPIEHLWDFLKRKVAKKNCSSLKCLRKCIEKIWKEEIPDDLIKNLINSIPKRIKACLENKGGHIPY